MSRILPYLLPFLLLFYSCGGGSSNSGKQPTEQTVIHTESVNTQIITENTNPVKGEPRVGDDFPVPEPIIAPSPEMIYEIRLPEGETVIDYKVSATATQAVALTGSNGNSFIRIWDIGKSGFSSGFALPETFKAKNIALHPEGNTFFVTVESQNKHHILRVGQNNGKLAYNIIYSSDRPLERLVITPRPLRSYDYKEHKSYIFYRLYLGEEYNKGKYRIITVNEFGDTPYQVVGPEKTITKAEEVNGDFDPSSMVADYALPVAFHPAGHLLVWEDKRHQFHIARYWGEAWEDKYTPLETSVPLSGTIVPTPNGLGFVHHQIGKNGFGIYLNPAGNETAHLSNHQFTSAPLPLADGKGIVGVSVSDGLYTLQYAPVEMPLADVVNAWMFISSQDEIDLFEKNYGLFRSNNSDQLYKLYETENYYSYSDISRPYIVTTDIMWEIFGVAYQGIFILNEKEHAMPRFWEFADKAHSWLEETGNTSAWAPVFNTLYDLKAENKDNSEVQKILDEEDGYSELIDDRYAYSDLKPRGHYTSSPEMENYFRAFRYFTTIYLKKQDTLKELNSFPDELKNIARQWIDAYSWLIAPSRAPLVWDNMKNDIPAYTQYPNKDSYVFPLSWGIDNEILYSTVFHEDFPPELQIIGAKGERRVFPQGLDLATVLGSGFADRLLQNDFEKYPNLRKVINRLKDNFRKNYNDSGNVYNQWMDALSVQWVDDFESPNGEKDRAIWQTKRLQTGLASWATLRHATILVNERGAAEMGEAGFETLVMREPRGTVEPDPNTFAAIARLFENMSGYMTGLSKEKEDTEAASLYKGVIDRLDKAAEEVRKFGKMAEKVSKNIPLDEGEFEDIMFVARVAEHYFLLFGSISNDEYAMSEPDPMPKIADVMRDEKYAPYPVWMVAVGNAMEWNHIVPYYGRRQIVKGSVYSYYELESEQILNDEEWREQVEHQEFLPWIAPYITEKGAKQLYYDKGY